MVAKISKKIEVKDDFLRIKVLITVGISIFFGDSKYDYS